MPRVLHIEDDPANRLLVRKLLSPAGYEVIDAVDGIEGIRKARSERPDLVLIDIAIPGLDGYEVTLRLRAEPHLQGVPIVAITAEGDRDTSLSVGCDGFVQKPIDARSFATTLNGFVAGYRERMSPSAEGRHLRLQSQRIVAHLERKIEELSEANTKLTELDRARKQFYRNVSHELATPMTPIVGYIKLLGDGELGVLSSQQHKALKAVDECVHRLRWLIDNLLDVTGIETNRLSFFYRPYDFNEMVRMSVERHRPEFEKAGLRLAMEASGTPLLGSGDADRLARALDHLLNNAAKFSPRGGVVGVRVRRLSSGHFELCVADAGSGVPTGAAERIFDPFYQVDGSPTRSHGGVGVGLAVVRGVARGHGGDVRVVSPCSEKIGGVLLEGAAFYLMVSEKAPGGTAVAK
ncbi:MAG TPA: hybrid sensor histidine kinase/response regulator [Polyangiaceae bacterium]|jgi:signal transduction histidine kinase